METRGILCFFLFIVTLWKGAGYSMMLFLASFQSIPEELEEAALIDGASERQSFFYILIPMLRPTITNILVLSYIWALTSFDLPYILGGSTGGVGGVIDFVAMVFYRTAFGTTGENNIGMGTTIAVCMFFVVLAGSLMQMLIVNRKQSEMQ